MPLPRIHQQQELSPVAIAQGAVIGALIGDTLGSYLEFAGKPKPETVKKAFSLPGGGHWGVSPGQVTDDGEMTLCQLRGLLEAEELAVTPIEAIARRYCLWSMSKPFDMGTTTFSALGWAQGKKACPKNCAKTCTSNSGKKNNRSKANGSLMRMTPAAVYAAGIPLEAAVTLIKSDCDLSHPNTFVVDACVLYMIAIRHLVLHPKDVTGAIKNTVGFANGTFPNSGKMRKISPDVAEWLRIALEEPKKLPPFYPQPGFVKIAFSYAFYYLKKGTPWLEAMQEVLTGGGDTDTNACIISGLLGAAYGIHSFPPEYISKVVSCTTTEKILRHRPDEFRPTENIFRECEALVKNSSTERVTRRVTSLSPSTQLAAAALKENTFDDIENPNGIVDMPLLSLSQAPTEGATLQVPQRLAPFKAKQKRKPLKGKKTSKGNESFSSSSDGEEYNEELEAFYKSAEPLPNWEKPQRLFATDLPYWVEDRIAGHRIYPAGGTHPGYSGDIKREDVCIGIKASAEGEGDEDYMYWPAISADDYLASAQYHLDQTIEDNAFLLHHLLTPAECTFLIRSVKPHTVPVDKFFEQKYRKADRALIHCPLLAKELYQRLLPHLKGEDYKNRIPLCFGQQGVWVPFGLNDCIKFSRYEEGGLFSQHRDGPWIPREDQASIYTVVIYLNERFNGGQTELMRSHAAKPGDQGTLGAIGQRTGRSSNTLIFPVTGSTLIFNHDLWHAGAPVRASCSGAQPKWILRTELIMQRVHSLYVDRYAFCREENYQKLRQLYEASQQALFQGKRAEFVELYQQVIEMQQEAMISGANAMMIRGSSHAVIHPKLSSDTLGSIFMFLTDRELCCFMQCSHRTYYQVIQSDVWDFKYQRRFPKLLSVSCDYDVLQRSQFHYKTRLPLDWYTLYAQRLTQEVHRREEFLPGCLWISPEGPKLCYPSSFGRSFYEADCCRGIRGMLAATFDLSGETISVRTDQLEYDDRFRSHKHSGVTHMYYDRVYAPSYYGSWVSGFPMHVNQPDDERYELVENPSGSSKCIIHPRDGTVVSELLSIVVEECFDPVWHPLLVLGHYAWFDDAGKLLPYAKHTFMDQLFELTRTPAIRVVHPALAAVANLKMLDRDPLRPKEESDEVYSVGLQAYSLVAVVAPVPVLPQRSAEQAKSKTSKKNKKPSDSSSDEDDGWRYENPSDWKKRNVGMKASTTFPSPSADPTHYHVAIVDKHTLTVVHTATVAVPPKQTDQAARETRESFRELFNAYNYQHHPAAGEDDDGKGEEVPPLGTRDDTTTVSIVLEGGSDDGEEEETIETLAYSEMPVYVQLVTNAATKECGILHQDYLDTYRSSSEPTDEYEVLVSSYKESLVSLFERRAQVKPQKVLQSEDTFLGMAGLINALDYRDRCVFRPVLASGDLPVSIDPSMMMQQEIRPSAVPPVVKTGTYEEDDEEDELIDDDDEEEEENMEE